MSFLKQSPFYFFSTLGLIVIVASISVAFASPPASPYNPGETLEPACAPGDVNCSITTPAVSGDNSDITSLSGLTTALSVNQGGIGLNTIAANKLLYTSAPDILAELNLDSSLSIVAGVLGVTDGSITESKLDILDAPADGEILSWNNLNSRFEWIVDAVGGGSENSIWDTNTDTGIQTEETADEDIIRFDTAGIERMQIKNNGYVGIGTTNPGVTLEVQDTGDNAKIKLLDDDGVTFIQANLQDKWPRIDAESSSVNYSIGASDALDPAALSLVSDQPILFGSSGVERMRINVSDGKTYWPTGDGGNIVVDPAGAGELKKVGGDEFWSLAEESSFNGIVDTGYIHMGGTNVNPNLNVNNGTAAVDIARFQDNGSTVFEIKDGGIIRAAAADGGFMVWDPAGAGELGKIGGDVFWRLSEESFFQGIVDVGYLSIDNSAGSHPSLYVRNTNAAEPNKDDLVVFKSQNANIRHTFSAANSASDTYYAKYVLGDPSGYRMEMNAKDGSMSVLGGDNWWSLGEETFLKSYLVELGNPVTLSSRSDLKKVTIDNLLKLVPTDAPGTCNAGAKGDIYYDDSLGELCDCDGTSWAQVDGGGGC